MNDWFIGGLFFILIVGVVFTIIPWIFSFFYEMISMFLERFDLNFSKKTENKEGD